MEYSKKQKMFIRFLKEKRIFYIWLDFAFLSSFNDYHFENADFNSWFNSCAEESYIMCGFNWDDCNSHYDINLYWCEIHHEWVKTLNRYIKL